MHSSGRGGPPIEYSILSLIVRTASLMASTLMRSRFLSHSNIVGGIDRLKNSQANHQVKDASIFFFNEYYQANLKCIWC